MVHTKKVTFSTLISISMVMVGASTIASAEAPSQSELRQKVEKRIEAHQEKRGERKEAHQEKRSERKEARQEKREERKEARKEKRQERHDTLKAKRQEKRSQRHEQGASLEFDTDKALKVSIFGATLQAMSGLK